MQRMMIERLSVLEKDVLNSIKNDVQDEKKDMTISAVARRNFVSQALLVKLSKKMGFSGYRDLLFYLRHSQTEEEKQSSLWGAGEGGWKTMIRNYSDSLQQQFQAYFEECKGTLIAVFGTEDSALAADFIVRHMMEKRKGFFAYRGRPFTRIREEEAGLAIIISDTGEGETSVEMIGQARRLGYHTLVFTGNDRSRAAAEADLPVIIGEGGAVFESG